MKKLTACLLALMMLAMPFAAMADYAQDALDAGRLLTTAIEYDVTADTLTGTPEVDQIIIDLLEAMKITVTQQGDEGGFVLGLEQADGTVNDVLSLAVASADKDAYIASNLLGGTIVISAEEVVPVVNRLIDLFVMLGFFGEEDAAEMKAMVTELEKMIAAEMETMLASVNVEDIDLTKIDLTALEGVVTKLSEKMTVENVTMQPKNCDPAAMVATITLTPDEMNEMLVAILQVLKDNPEVCAAFGDSFMAGFNSTSGMNMTFDEMLDTMITELPKEQIYSGDVTYRIYMDAAGTVCAMEAVAPMDDETSVTLNYTRLTLNDGVAHSAMMSVAGADMTVNCVVKEKTVAVTFDMAENGANLFSLKVDVTDRSAENLIACDVALSMDISVEGEPDYVYDEATEEWTIVEGEAQNVNIAVTYTQDVTLNGVDFTEADVISFSVNGVEYLRATGNTVTSDPAESIMAGKVVRPAELSDADFANWFVGVYNNLASWLMNLVTSLPQSVSSLLMGM